MSEVVGAIDIGSNAMRCAIGGLDPDGKLVITFADRAAISLGRVVFASGSISNGIQASAVQALGGFRKCFRDAKVRRYRAVGTSALRDATNQSEFVEIARREADISIDVISGEEEARLIRKAVLHKVDLTKQDALLLDIGGGSVEVSLLSDTKLIAAKSERLGTVRLIKKLSQSDLGARAFGKLVQRAIESFLKELDASITPRKVDVMVATGGNVEALGELRVKLLDKKNSRKLRLGELERIMDTLMDMSYDERIEKLKLREDRADVIVPAGVVLSEVMRHAGINEILIPNVGLREGVLLDTIENS